MKKNTVWLLASLLLAGCGGGDPSIEVIGDSVQTPQADGTYPETNGQASLVVNLSAQRRKADTRALQSTLWVSDCASKRRTKLEFTAEFLLSSTVTYVDASCTVSREDIQQNSTERFSIENAELLDTGITAGRLLLTTVQSQREELYYFEGQTLFMGVKGSNASYKATSLDFNKPYFPAPAGWTF